MPDGLLPEATDVFPAPAAGPTARWSARLRGLGARALDLLLPPRCLACGDIVGAPGTLCPGCWTAVRFIAPPMCDCCGRPFEFQADGVNLCGPCIASPPEFDAARAVFVYDTVSRNLVLRFKHADRTDAAPAFATWMARAAADILPGVDLIGPVPLHWTRLFRRRYNQSALLALELGKRTGITAVPDLMIRRHPGTQGGQTRAGRERMVAHAFALPKGGAEQVRGKSVLLIDDVMTTGATATACARVLRRAGAARIAVLTLARVVRAEAA